MGAVASAEVESRVDNVLKSQCTGKWKRCDGILDGFGAHKAFARAARGDGSPTPGKPDDPPTPAHAASQGFSRATFIAQRTTALTEVYEMGPEIGAGNRGGVRQVKEKATGVTWALKSVRKAQVGSIQRFQRMVDVMKLVDHPNIIRLKELFEDRRNYYLVLEYAAGGKLLDRVLAANAFAETDAAIVMQQLFRSMTYLHDHRICHRDVKPEAILFDEKKSFAEAGVKLVHFSCAALVDAGGVMTTRIGSPLYVAPEVVQGRYDFSCDVWSCGVILYVLLSGEPPFVGETEGEIIGKVRVGKVSLIGPAWKSVSGAAKDLVRWTLKLNTAVRFSAEQCLNHEWIKDAATLTKKASLDSSMLTSMRSFASSSMLKKAAIVAVAHNMDQKSLVKLKHVFQELDQDGDGTLTVKEVVQALEQTGLADCTELVQGLDTDNTSTVDYTEFLAAAMDKHVYMQEDAIWTAFRSFDLDGDGCISEQELHQVLASGAVDSQSVAKVREMMQECDFDGNGTIDFDEFLAMMRS
mmetsp:Transcript_10679/g.25402  ORF Transcript_10679/g.25402 Transcript_10679/m.25402 type:complete len:524 (+) Transcript_10679:28-1599(+)